MLGVGVSWLAPSSTGMSDASHLERAMRWSARSLVRDGDLGPFFQAKQGRLPEERASIVCIHSVRSKCAIRYTNQLSRQCSQSVVPPQAIANTVDAEQSSQLDKSCNYHAYIACARHYGQASMRQGVRAEYHWPH